MHLSTIDICIQCAHNVHVCASSHLSACAYLPSSSTTFSFTGCFILWLLFACSKGALSSASSWFLRELHKQHSWNVNINNFQAIYSWSYWQNECSFSLHNTIVTNFNSHLLFGLTCWLTHCYSAERRPPRHESYHCIPGTSSWVHAEAYSSCFVGWPWSCGLYMQWRNQCKGKYHFTCIQKMAMIHSITALCSHRYCIPF